MTNDEFNEFLIQMLQGNFNSLKDDIRETNNKLSEFVTDSKCKERRGEILDKSVRELKLKTKELSIRKITAITGVITGSSLIIVTLIKIFFKAD